MRTTLTALACAALALSLSACGGNVFNTDNSGNSRCPDYLFLNAASRNQATCNSAPQQCNATSPESGSARIVCTCDGPTGMPGTWSCREMQP